MYKWEIVANRIRALARKKRLSILGDLEAGGADSKVDSKGIENGIYSFSLAKIADYLGCSVDYLLGRTAISNSHLFVDENDIADANLSKFIRKYKRLNTAQRMELIALVQKVKRQAQDNTDEKTI